jgi:hypothetical protein
MDPKEFRDLRFDFDEARKRIEAEFRTLKQIEEDEAEIRRFNWQQIITQRRSA